MSKTIYPASMLIKRLLAQKAQTLARQFPIVAITGPRQSGKTTLAKMVFAKKPYANLENPETLEFALQDPRGFLEQYPDGAILDEIQRAPKLFSYLQDIVDQKRKKNLFILTGSQQFGMLEKITQSLAGRVALLHLLPFSLEELKGTPQEPRSMEQILFQGSYPRIYDQDIDPVDWFSNYLQTYVERDVRLIKNIDNLMTFRKFVKMCAARTGQLLNLTSLGNDCGITHNAAKSWISILEASFLIFLLPPHYRNFNKRLVKSPKLYFWDTGLACRLLDIELAKTLATHAKRGDLFETWVISELMKQFTHAGKRPNLFFWQDKHHEIDLIVDRGEALIPVEIKAGKTIVSDYFKNLAYWGRLAKKNPRCGMLIYAGTEVQKREQGQVFGWNHLPKIV